jgi:hypothetical protein
MNGRMSKHFRIVTACAFAIACALATPLASIADQPTDVRVLLPQNLRTETPFTTPAGGGFKYVTVPGIVAADPSRYTGQSYAAGEFHLLVDDTVYYPVTRPGLGSIDFTSTDVVAPHEAIHVTVSFLVPDDVETASFEFTPHWQTDDGGTVDFCCGY